MRWEVEGYVCLETAGETPITLAEVSEAHPSPHAILNFHAPDVEEAHRALSEQGVEVGPIQAGPGVRWFAFPDADRHLLGVCTW